MHKAERNKTVHKEVITQYYPLHRPLNTEHKLILSNKLQSANSPKRSALNIIIGTRPILRKHLSKTNEKRNSQLSLKTSAHKNIYLARQQYVFNTMIDRRSAKYTFKKPR